MLGAPPIGLGGGIAGTASGRVAGPVRVVQSLAACLVPRPVLHADEPAKGELGAVCTVGIWLAEAGGLGNLVLDQAMRQRQRGTV